MTPVETVDRLELFCQEELEGLAEIVNCSDEEKADFQKRLANGLELPEGVRYYWENEADSQKKAVFYWYSSELDQEEKMEYIALQQLAVQKKLHFWVKFWSVLAISVFCAGLALGLIAWVFLGLMH